MVDRITYQDNLQPGQVFTADMADEIRDVINALGTAADINAGSAAGNVPILDSGGKLPIGTIPDAVLGGGGGGGGSGDVLGPSGATGNLVALFDGTSGKAIKEGTAAQTLPTTGTTGYWLTFGASSPSWVTTISLASSLSALTSSDRIAYTGINGLDGVGAAALYETALIAKGTPTALQVLRTNAANNAFEWVTLGTAAFVDVIPAGEPTNVESSSGAITLDFDGVDELATTTDEAITTITFDNIAEWSTVVWWVTHGATGYNITFPAGTVMKGNGGLLAVTGVANTDVAFLIRNKGGTYVVQVGDQGVVGS